MRFVKGILGKDRINPKFTISTSSPASTFGGGGDVHLNTANGKIFKKDNKKGWVEVYDLVTAAESGSFDSLTLATGLIITAAGDVNEPAIKIGNGVNGFYQVSGTQLGVSVSDALATYFGTDGIYTDAVFPRVTQGTTNTGVTAVTTGDGRSFTTVLTVNVIDALTLGSGVALGDGYLLYTFPPGAILVTHSVLENVSIQAGSTELQADTPKFALGKTQASGAINNLTGYQSYSGVAKNAIDCNGTLPTNVFANGTSGVNLQPSDPRTIYFNVADDWATDLSADLTADIVGTVSFKWTLMS